MKSVLFISILYFPFCFVGIPFCTFYAYFTVRVCVRHGVFLDLHTGFRLQVEFVTDIMLTGFAKHHIA